MYLARAILNTVRPRARYRGVVERSPFNGRAQSALDGRKLRFVLFCITLAPMEPCATVPKKDNKATHPGRRKPLATP